MLMKKLNEKVDAIPDLEPEFRENLREPVTRYWMTFAIEESRGRMSLLPEISGKLRPGSPAQLVAKVRLVGTKQEQ